MGSILEEVEAEHLKLFPKERDLLLPFLAGFSVTWAKQRSTLGTKLSVYFLKPERLMEEAFGFEREMLLAYSPYAELQPRVVQAVEQFMSEQPARGRVDPMIVFLVSESPDPESWARQYLMLNPDSRLLAGFSADGLRQAKSDSWHVRTALGRQLFQRDLFDYRLPLRSDTYFFGREDLAFDVLNAIKRFENRGLFGLRKTGKTSFLFKLQRMTEATESGHYLYYDCKYPGIRASDWESLLNRIAADIQRLTSPQKRFAGQSAADRFLNTVSSAPAGKPIALVFDEIEYISPFTRLDPHWSEGFVPFWQTLWTCQSQFKRLSILIAGVNPTIVEQDLVGKVQNPLFGIVPTQYLTGLRADELQRLVRTIGKRMGLRFENAALEYLHARYGGHPLLTRIACSLTHRRITELSKQRPFIVSQAFLQENETERDSELSFYCRHVVSELSEFYHDEYAVLELLASGQIADFMDFAVSPEFTTHLSRYGLLGRDSVGRPAVSIPVVGRYLALELARREGRKTILRLVPAGQRQEWLKRRIEAIDSQFGELQRLIARGSAPALFGPNSYPESHKFHNVPLCGTENEFAIFINVCHRCFVESIEAVGRELQATEYLNRNIRGHFPALFDALYRIKLYRHHRAHLKLYPHVEAEVKRFLVSDLEGRSPGQVEDVWFVLQQCVLDALLTALITEADRLG